MSAMSAIPSVWRSLEKASRIATPYSSERDRRGSGAARIRGARGSSTVLSSRALPARFVAVLCMESSSLCGVFSSSLSIAISPRRSAARPHPPVHQQEARWDTGLRPIVGEYNRLLVKTLQHLAVGTSGGSISGGRDACDDRRDELGKGHPSGLRGGGGDTGLGEPRDRVDLEYLRHLVLIEDEVHAGEVAA